MKISLEAKLMPAIRVTSTLFWKSRSAGAGAYRPVFLESARNRMVVPLNTEEAVLGDFVNIALKDRNSGQFDYTKPYWLSGEQYNPYELFYGSIQFVDDHNEPLPTTILPPEKDVETYIQRVISSQGKMSLSSQLKLSMEVTKNNIVGATNLCFVASRLLARGSDLRAYPNLKVKPVDLAVWNNHISQFETYDGKDTCDGPGDTYYFWTHFFVALVCGFVGDVRFSVMQNAFANGTDLMLLVRNQLVGQPTVSSHKEASEIGINVGLAIADLLKN